jgi:hypothetical protein
VAGREGGWAGGVQREAPFLLFWGSLPSQYVSRKNLSLPGFPILFLFFEARSHCAAQAGLKLVIFLSHVPGCWDYRCAPPRPASAYLGHQCFETFLLIEEQVAI